MSTQCQLKLIYSHQYTWHWIALNLHLIDINYILLKCTTHTWCHIFIIIKIHRAPLNTNWYCGSSRTAWLNHSIYSSSYTNFNQFKLQNEQSYGMHRHNKYCTLSETNIAAYPWHSHQQIKFLFVFHSYQSKKKFNLIFTKLIDYKDIWDIQQWQHLQMKALNIYRLI